jgi:hypothetical protein
LCERGITVERVSPQAALPYLDEWRHQIDG